MACPHLYDGGKLPPLPAGEARRGRAERVRARQDRRSPAGPPPPSPSIAAVRARARARSTSPTPTPRSASNCTASASGWAWTVTGAAPLHAPPRQHDHGHLGGDRHEDGVGDQQRLLRRPSRPATVTINTGDTGGGTLQALSPSRRRRRTWAAGDLRLQPVDRRARGRQLGLDFGDGSPTSRAGRRRTSTPARQLRVQLSITPSRLPQHDLPEPGGEDLTWSLVGPPPPPGVGGLSSSATCTNVFGIDQCKAATGTAVTLTAASTDDRRQLQLDLRRRHHRHRPAGDATPGPPPGSYSGQPDGGKASRRTATKTRTSWSPARRRLRRRPQVGAAALARAEPRRAACSRATSTSTTRARRAMSVTLEFRKRGLPESNPPRVDQTHPAGSDAVRSPTCCARSSTARTWRASSRSWPPRATAEPVITSFNTTVRADGKLFGQTIPGISLSQHRQRRGHGPDGSSQYLVGLHDNAERQAYFGFSNPSDQPANYRLRFFDRTGRLISESAGPDRSPASASGSSRLQEIRDTFGIYNLDDYRVEVKTVSGAQVSPLRLEPPAGHERPVVPRGGLVRTPKALSARRAERAGPRQHTLADATSCSSNVGDQASRRT